MDHYGGLKTCAENLLQSSPQKVESMFPLLEPKWSCDLQWQECGTSNSDLLLKWFRKGHVASASFSWEMFGYPESLMGRKNWKGKRERPMSEELHFSPRLFEISQPRHQTCGWENPLRDPNPYYHLTATALETLRKNRLFESVDF